MFRQVERGTAGAGHCVCKATQRRGRSLRGSAPLEKEPGEARECQLPGPAQGCPCRGTQCPPHLVQELEELQRKLEDRLAQQEATQQQQALASWQRWVTDGPELLSEPGAEDSTGQVSATLQQALGKSQKLLEQQQQR